MDSSLCLLPILAYIVIAYLLHMLQLRRKWSGLVGAQSFLAAYSMFRLCWLRGRRGSGKTCLAVAIANEFITRKIVDGAVCNFPTSLPLPDWREHWLQHCMVVLDEGWKWLDARTSMGNPREYGALARHTNTYWLFPSVTALDKRVSEIIVERAFKLGLPMFPTIWVYRWEIQLGYAKESGFFGLLHPSKYFGMYDTHYIPMTDGDISEAWSRTMFEVTKDQPLTSKWWVTAQEYWELTGVYPDGYTPPTDTDNGQEGAGQTTERRATEQEQPSKNGHKRGDTLSSAERYLISHIRDTARAVQNNPGTTSAEQDNEY